MSRLQLALNVDDLDEAIGFYSRLFGTEPAKVRPGYANFAVEQPPLKLILFHQPGKGGTINHLGVEVGDTTEVVAAQRRLEGQGFATRSEQGVECCYALQDKFWLDSPEGHEWEIYTVLADAEALRPAANAESAACCAELAAADPEARAGSTSATGCCN